MGEKDGNRLAPDPDYMVEALKLTFKTPRVSEEPLQNSDRLDRPDRYTRDFKYPHNQKSAGVKSGDRGGHGYLQRF
ncbi:hypothetical protein TNCV_745881 [Trichonephila clavipes]|nr:hypothetical protein TNCV_745881 [Trichonephila clavipes]